MINENRSIQSVERSMLLLEHIAQRQGSAKLSELASALNLPKSTVYGLLNTLAALGYISRQGTAYTLGLRLNTISKHVIHLEDEIKQYYHTFIQQIAKLSGQTCYLAIACGSKEYLYLAAYHGTTALNIEQHIRSPRESLTASAIGKVILANSPDLIRSLGRADLLPSELVHEFKQIQIQGYALDLENTQQGLNCIAIPLFKQGVFTAALGISGSKSDFTQENMLALLPKIF
ncbi:IclR family transcriptional regulator [Acinetobacter qingfengensis]|nr:helix-turn-helix domain-containing protein [Acinetobacter qingfengensis]